MCWLEYNTFACKTNVLYWNYTRLDWIKIYILYWKYNLCITEKSFFYFNCNRIINLQFNTFTFKIWNILTKRKLLTVSLTVWSPIGCQLLALLPQSRLYNTRYFFTHWWQHPFLPWVIMPRIRLGSERFTFKRTKIIY